jgi:hypothetical protein
MAGRLRSATAAPRPGRPSAPGPLGRPCVSWSRDEATGRGCWIRGPPAPARGSPGGHPVATASPCPARGPARSGSARDRPATDRPARPAVHRRAGRSRCEDAATLAPRIAGSRPVFGAKRRLTVNFGKVSPSYPSQPLQTARRDRPRRGGRTVPLPPVPSRRDRVPAGITRARPMTPEARPRTGRGRPASGSRDGSSPRRGDGAAHILPAANGRLRRSAARPALDPVRLFHDRAPPPINRMPQLCNFLNAMRRFCGCASSQPLLRQGEQISNKILQMQHFSEACGVNYSGERG